MKPPSTGCSVLLGLPTVAARGMRPSAKTSAARLVGQEGAGVADGGGVGHEHPAGRGVDARHGLDDVDLGYGVGVGATQLRRQLEAEEAGLLHGLDDAEGKRAVRLGVLGAGLDSGRVRTRPRARRASALGGAVGWECLEIEQ